VLQNSRSAIRKSIFHACPVHFLSFFLSFSLFCLYAICNYQAIINNTSSIEEGNVTTPKIEKPDRDQVFDNEMSK